MISLEDKKDVKNVLGKAIANKVGKATKDFPENALDRKYRIQDAAIMAEHKFKTDKKAPKRSFLFRNEMKKSGY